MVHKVLLILFIFTEIAFAETKRGDFEQQQRIAIGQFLNGRFDSAETYFLAAFRQAEEDRDDHAIALSLIGLGDVYQNQRHYHEAKDAYEKGLAALRRVPGSDLSTAVLLHNLGECHSALGRYREALSVLKEASRIIEKLGPPADDLDGMIANDFGIVYFYQGKDNKAEAFFQSAIKIYSGKGRKFAPAMAQSINNVAEIYRKRRQFQKAEDSYKEAISITEQHLGASHPNLTMLVENLGSLYSDLKRYGEAEAQYQRSIAILEGSKSLNLRMIHAQHGLGRVYIRKGDDERAETTLARAVELIGPQPSSNPEIPIVLELYSGLLKLGGKPQQADAVHGRAVRAMVSMTSTVRAQDLD